MPQIRIFITHEEVFGDLPPLTWVRQVLANYPLAGVLRVFTRILHEVESGGDNQATLLKFLQQVASHETHQRILRALFNRPAGRPPAIVFSEINLLNFLKEAVRYCRYDDGTLERADTDLLLRAYIATHDHFPPGVNDGARSGPKAHLKAIEEDLLRQTLLGLNRPLSLLVPRYWALWVTIPKRLGLTSELERFYTQASGPSMVHSFLLALSAHAYWFTRADSIFEATMLRRAYWKAFPDRMGAVEAWLSEVSLDAAAYRAALEKEYTGLGREDVWEYSFLTFQNSPLIWIGEDIYCLSLRLLINRAGDGVYYRMLDACGRDEAKVKRLGGLFGAIFHEYTYRQWERIVSPGRIRYVKYGKEQKEAGDGLIDNLPNLLIYDAKSTRFNLRTARTGKVSLMRKDLQRGVIRAAEQLNVAVQDIQAGQLDSFLQNSGYSRVYPLVVTATDFPGIPTVDRAIHEALDQQNLLKMDGVAHLQVVDAEGLELLESADSVGLDPVALLVERGDSEASRVTGVKDLIYDKAGKIPENPRMKRAFLAMMEGLEEWLTTGAFDEAKIDGLLLPPT